MAMAGIRKEGDHWRWFDEHGRDGPGEFFNSEAARWGSWMTADDAEQINNGEHRLIIMDDIRAKIRSVNGDPPTDEFITLPRMEME